MRDKLVQNFPENCEIERFSFTDEIKTVYIANSPNQRLVIQVERVSEEDE